MPESPQLPPIATQPLSVLLLGQSDRPDLEQALDEWIAYLNGLEREHDVLLIDDAAIDQTEELAKRHPGIRVLRDPARRGVGAALRQGLAEARHPLLLYAPCDGQYQPGDLRLLLAEIDRVHAVMGHRVGCSVPLPLRIIGFLWRLLLRVLFGMPVEALPAWLGWRGHAKNLMARIVFGVRLHDVACPFRLFRREVFRRIPIQSNGPFVHIEILAKANFLTAMMSEVPVICRNAAPLGGWREAWRIFAHPDFGPARLPDKTAPSSPGNEATNPPP